MIIWCALHAIHHHTIPCCIANLQDIETAFLACRIFYDIISHHLENKRTMRFWRVLNECCAKIWSKPNLCTGLDRGHTKLLATGQVILIPHVFTNFGTAGTEIRL